jgi:hypothetical protein
MKTPAKTNMTHRLGNLACLAVFLVGLPAGSAFAAPLVPAGLSPGDTYHLAFVTDGSRDATSTEIADYNAFVQAEAERSGVITEGYGISWFAIASTETVHARDNALVQAPVYLLDGTTKIADGFDDIWDASLDAPLNLSQFGTQINFIVWTGTHRDGFAEPFGHLGALGGPLQGSSSSTSRQWLENDGSGVENPLPFYALSQLLTVVPEPSSLILCIAGAGALLAYRHRRRGRATG